MFLRPLPGRTVRDPVKGTYLPEKGAQVEDSVFWRRRLRDGDVEDFTPSETADAAIAATSDTADTSGK